MFSSYNEDDDLVLYASKIIFIICHIGKIKGGRVDDKKGPCNEELYNHEMSSAFSGFRT